MKNKKAILEHLQFIYGEQNADHILPQLLSRLQTFQHQQANLPRKDSFLPRVTEKDSILITYGDMVQCEDITPLQSLGVFLKKSVADTISTVHLLPFFPYSSDDGFSVIEYRQVNPAIGDWDNIRDLGKNFRLMFDAVINHISAKSEWFKGYLRGIPKYQDYFFEVPNEFDTSNVFRPRALPLLTKFQTENEVKHLWTTFSEDQIDLNYRNPELLLEVIEVLLWYVAHGAEFIRLDAIAFIWKESGTNCIHLPQTHRIIKLLRSILDIVAPGVSIITETNVPHAENIAYFGNGYNEAQMVYNFSLPPLTLHAFHIGNTEILSQWAESLSFPSKHTTFFNFLASHDGIGLMPARGFLSETEIAAMSQRVEALGGHVSYKNNLDGSQTPYELNINYLDALGDPEKGEEEIQHVARRFLASQAIMLALRGVPGIYFHSLFGSQNWREGVELTGRYRSINREKLQLKVLERELKDPNSLRHQVFNGFKTMLQIRRSNPAFHPQAGLQIKRFHASIFALLRTSLDGNTQVLCLNNVTSQRIDLRIELAGMAFDSPSILTDLLSQRKYQVSGDQLKLGIDPYQVLWLKSS